MRCPDCKTNEMELQCVCEFCGHREAASSSCTSALNCSAADTWQDGSIQLIDLAGIAERAGRTTDANMLRYVSDGWRQHAGYIRRQNAEHQRRAVDRPSGCSCSTGGNHD
jgi:hypothetical protein